MADSAKPSLSSVNQTSSLAWMVTILAVLIGGFLFLKPFFSVIALALLTAYLFNPIYQKLNTKLKGRKSLAVTLTTIIAILIIGIPLALVLLISVAQAVKLADSLGINPNTIGNINIASGATSLVNELNDILNSLFGIENAVSTNSVVEALKQLGPKLANAFIDLMSSLVTSIPSFITSTITYLFVLVGVLLGQDKLLQTVRSLSPFGDDINNHYLKKIGLMCNAMVKGQLLIAFCQGLASALVVCLALGIMDYFFFLLILFTFMSLIPLGAGIITIPMGIIAILFGEFWQGTVILLNHFLVVTNIDNFIRPKVVPKEAHLPASLTLLAAFAGVGLFGLLGVVYGPIIMIFIVTTIEMYADYKKSLQAKAKA